jgi:hypothetical protein
MHGDRRVPDLAGSVTAAEDFYAARGAPPRFRVCPACPPGLDEELALRGYERSCTVTLQVGAIRHVARRVSPPVLRVDLAEHPDDPWCSVATSGHGVDVDLAAERRLLERVRRPSVYATAHLAGRPVAVGRAVADSGWVGVFGMQTLPGACSQGAARAVLASLGGCTGGPASKRRAPTTTGPWYPADLRGRRRRQGPPRTSYTHIRFLRKENVRDAVYGHAMTTNDQWTPPPWEPPLAGNEVEQLLGALDRLRTTFRWKADDLDSAGLQTRIGASSLTLGGLLKHLAAVEDYMFTVKLRGEPIGAPWDTTGWDGDNAWEFNSAAHDTPDELYALYDGAVERARARLAAALADGGLDQLTHASGPDGRQANLRRLVCDLVEEYGRHTGHADLLREAVDGRVGEDPPEDWRARAGAYHLAG